jgi:hypothetical protein
MRIRKEISPWNGKMFIRITLIVFVIYNGLMLLAKTLDGDALFSLSYTWLFNCIIQPLVFASIFTNASRKMTLFINDFQNIDSFEDKLNTNILNKGMSANQGDDNTAHYVATGWFYKLFNHWDRTETVSVKWGNEVVIKGSSRIVSQVEDSLTWNKAFKS